MTEGFCYGPKNWSGGRLGRPQAGFIGISSRAAVTVCIGISSRAAVSVRSQRVPKSELGRAGRWASRRASPAWRHSVTLCLLRGSQLHMIGQQWLGQALVVRQHCREPCWTGEGPGRSRGAETANGSGPAFVSPTYASHCPSSHWKRAGSS